VRFFVSSAVLKSPPERKAEKRYKQAEKKRQRQDEKEFLLHKDKEVK
jgi:hypothetical protein